MSKVKIFDEAGLAYEIPPMSKRIIAFLIDTILIISFSSYLNYLFQSYLIIENDFNMADFYDSNSLFLAAAFFSYHFVSDLSGNKGSIGKWIMGIILADISLYKASLRKVLIRNLLKSFVILLPFFLFYYFESLFIAGLFLWLYILLGMDKRKDKRSLYDRISGTVLVLRK